MSTCSTLQDLCCHVLGLSTVQARSRMCQNSIVSGSAAAPYGQRHVDQNGVLIDFTTPYHL